jgi:hypothetical protein
LPGRRDTEVTSGHFDCGFDVDTIDRADPGLPWCKQFGVLVFERESG